MRLPNAGTFFHVRSTAWVRLQSLDSGHPEDCLRRVRDRLSGLDEDGYIIRGAVVVATAAKPKGGLEETPMSYQTEGDYFESCNCLITCRSTFGTSFGGDAGDAFLAGT